MKKLLSFAGLVILIIAGIVGAYVNISSVTLGPAVAYTTSTLEGNVTCDSDSPVTAYWNVFKDSVNMSSLAGSASLANNTRTTVVTIASTLISKGETWQVKAWCEDNASSATSQVASNQVVIQNSAPVASSVTINPTTATPSTAFTCSGSSSDADGDAMSKYYRFLVDSAEVQAFTAADTFTCTSTLCPVGSIVKCQFKASDGTVESGVVESSGVTISAPASSIAIEDMAIGGSSQEKSNPDEDDFYITATKSVTVSNTGTSTLTGINITNVNVPSKYNVSFSPETISSLTPGASTTVTVKAIVPEDFDAFDPDASNPQDDRAFAIGTIKAEASGGASDTASVTMETENKLVIYRLYVSVDDDEERVDDGDSLDKISPGAKIRVRLIADSTYSSGSDVDMEDIEMMVEIDEGDIDEDESDDLSDIDAGDDRVEGEVEFTIDSDVDEDTYTMVVTLTGEDSYGAMHGEQWEIELEVEKEDEEISINSAALSPETVSCSRSSTLTVKIENTGKDDSDEIVLLVKNDELGIFSKTSNIDLDDGDDYTKTVSISVGSTVRAGSYNIGIYTYFDADAYEDNDVSKFRTVTLKVEDCGSTTPSGGSDEEDEEESKDETDVVVDTGKDKEDVVVDIVDQEGAAVAREPVEFKRSIDNSTFIALIVLGYVVAIGILIALLIHLFSRRR